MSRSNRIYNSLQHSILMLLAQLGMRLSILSLALVLLAALVGHRTPKLTIVFVYDSKLQLFDVQRSLNSELRGDYLASPPSLNDSPVTSPNGKYIAVSQGNSGVLIFNLELGNRRMIPLPSDQLVWSPNSQYIAAATLNFGENPNDQWADIQMANLATGEVQQITQSHRHVRIWALALSPDNQRITFVAQDSIELAYTLYAVNRDGSDLDQLNCSLDGASWEYDFTPDGDWLAFPAIFNDVYLIHVLHLPDCQRTLISQGKIYDASPRWSPDGQRLAFLSGRDGQTDVYVMDADGSNVERLTATPDNEALLGWSPDGQHLLYYIYPQKGGVITLAYADLATHNLHGFDLHHGQFQSFPVWGT